MIQIYVLILDVYSRAVEHAAVWNFGVHDVYVMFIWKIFIMLIMDQFAQTVCFYPIYIRLYKPHRFR